MLCDEITSSIDFATDTVVHDILFNLTDVTVLAICHRLHHIAGYDHVVVS